MLSCVFWNQPSKITHEITCVYALNSRIYTGSSTGEICYWESDNPYLICSSSSAPCLYLSSASSPNPTLLSCKQLLLSIHQDNKLRSWDSEDGRCLNSTKLSEISAVLGIETSQNRIIIIWSLHCAVIYDSWTLAFIRTVKFGSQINSVKILNNSKIIILHSHNELVFKSFKDLRVDEKPYFVYSLPESCRDFDINQGCTMLCCLYEKSIGFFRLEDIKYKNPQSGVISFQEVKKCSFVGDFFIVITRNTVYKYNSLSILKEIIGNNASQTRDLAVTTKDLCPNSRHTLTGTLLISSNLTTLSSTNLLSSPLCPSQMIFKIDESPTTCLCPSDKPTYSSILLQPWPVLLIGSSHGYILLKSLNPDHTVTKLHFHTSPITCVQICNECIISCTDTSELCISHADKTRGYCTLLSPAKFILKVSCIQDTTHNVNDIFWKNSWKNWEETILIHCEDLSIVLVSLVTNSVICSFNTQVPHVSEAMVHVLLEYLVIKSHEVVYVFNMMMQSLERISTGVAANELLRRTAAQSGRMDCGSSEDFVCDEHKVVESNWRVCGYNKKYIHSSAVCIQDTSNPVINLAEAFDDEYNSFVLSLLTCWDVSCSSHESLVKSYPDMRAVRPQPKFGLKGDHWQSYYISAKRPSKFIESLMIVNLMRISLIGCAMLRPTIGLLSYKSIHGSCYTQALIRDMTAAINPLKKQKIIEACTRILKMRSPSFASLNKTIQILNSLQKIELQSELIRRKTSLSESQACIILTYFNTDLTEDSIMLSITSLFSMLRSGNTNYAMAASKVISHTFANWKTLVATHIKGIIKELIILSTDSNCPDVFFKTLGTIVVTELRNYILLASEDIMNADAGIRKAWLNSIKWMVSYKYDQIAYSLNSVVEVLMKALNPHYPLIRKACVDQVSEILQILVLKLPMIAFSQAKQKIAVGTAENTIMIYDLKTAAFWKTLEGHEAPVSAVIFTRAGDSLVSYSAQDFSLRTWKVDVGFFHGLVGVKNIKPASVVLLPEVKRSVCNYKEFLDCVSLHWNSDSLKLVREDSRTYGFSIGV